MATKSKHHPAHTRRKRRRRLFLIGLPIVLAAVGWQVAERLIDIERYRGLIDKELELLIELPITFGAMDLKLFPLPRLVVQDVVLGEENFQVTAPTVSVTADLGKLIKRQLDLRTVTVHDARIQLAPSAEDFVRRWNAYMLALETPDGPTGKPMVKVTLAEIIAEDLAIYRGSTLFATGDLRVSDVTRKVTHFHVALTAPGVSGTPQANGSLALDVKADPLLTGQVDVSSLPLATLTGDHRLPAFHLDGTVDFRLGQDDQFSWTSQGSILPPTSEGPLGEFGLSGTYHRGDTHLNNLHIDTPPVRGTASVALPGGPGWTLTVAEAELEGDGVDWLLRFLPDVPLQPSVNVAPACTLRDLRLGEDGQGIFSVATGTVQTRGVDLYLAALPMVVDGLESHVEIRDDHYAIRAITSEHVQLSGELGNGDGGALTLALSGSAHLDADFPLPPDIARNLQLLQGEVSLRHFSTRLHNEEPSWAHTRLDLSVEGAAVALWNEAQGTFVPVDGIGGTVAIDGGAICLDQFVAMGTTVTGEAIPEPDFDTWRFQAGLESDLTSPVWLPLYPDDIISLQAGTIRCPSISGTYTRSSGTLAALALTGNINEVSGELHTSSFTDRFQIGRVELSAADNSVAYALTGTSTLAGTVGIEGAFRPDSGEADTRITIAPAPLLAQLDREDAWPEAVEIAEERLGPVTLETRYNLADRALSFKATSPLTLSGTLHLGTAGGVEQIQVLADFPAAWLSPLLPEDTRATGPLEVGLRYAPPTNSFTGTLGLDNVDARWRGLRKPAPLPAHVNFSGVWPDQGRHDVSGTLTLGAAQVEYRWSPVGLEIPTIDLDLADLAPCLPAESQLAGRVSGHIGRLGSDGRLTVADVQLLAGDSAPLLTVDGTVAWVDGVYTVEHATLASDGQSVEVALALDGRTLTGSATAERLDLDRAQVSTEGGLAWWDRVLGTAADTPDGRDGLMASIDIAVGDVRWAGASVEAVRLRAITSSRACLLEQLRFDKDGGSGSGTVQWHYAGATTPASVDVDLTVTDFPLAEIEAWLSDSSRNMAGTMDGHATLQVQLPEGSEDVLHETYGTVRFRGTDGTLGKAGLASKFLTALHTTDLLRMRIPSFRDEGVTFDVMEGSVQLQGGVLTLAPYRMEDSTYTLTADAQLDYPKDAATGVIELTVLEGVTGIASRIPILGEAADMVNKAFGVELRLSGRATDPLFLPGTPGPIKSLDEGVRSIFKGTQRLVGQ